jgi:hypothetical protein
VEGVIWCPDSLAEKMGLHSKTEPPGDELLRSLWSKEDGMNRDRVEKPFREEKLPYLPNEAGAF